MYSNNKFTEKIEILPKNLKEKLDTSQSRKFSEI